MAAISGYFTDSAVGEALRTQYDDRSCLKKTADLVMSFGRQLLYTSTVYYHKLFGENPQRCGQEIEWKKESQGLFVLLHGLRNAPAVWYVQLSLLKEYQVDVFAPVVPKRGFCSLEEAAAPILPTLEDYARKNPGKPLCLLGVSNGSRLVTWLEVALREKTPQTPVMISTIAGIHLGSRRMDLLEDWGLAKWFYPEAVREELRYGSDVAKELLEQVKAPSGAPRHYEFYATIDDFSVPDLDSSLPGLNKGEKYHVVRGHGHDSIVAAVAKRQIASCLSWISLQIKSLNSD